MDLGPRALAYLWTLSGGDVYGAGPGLELRIARLDRRPARIAESGYFGGACDFAEPISPNVIGATAFYGYSSGDACTTGGQRNVFRRFSFQRARRAEASPAMVGNLLSVAWDGPTVYWLRRNYPTTQCGLPDVHCMTELVRSQKPTIQRHPGRRSSAAVVLAVSRTAPQQRQAHLRVRRYGSAPDGGGCAVGRTCT